MRVPRTGPALALLVLLNPEDLNHRQTLSFDSLRPPSYLVKDLEFGIRDQATQTDKTPFR